MMMLAVFRSRAQSLDYGQQLNAYGIPATTMPTPKEAKIGCGLCVRFDMRYLTRAKAIVKIGGYTTFKGFYRLDYVNGRITVFPYG